MLQTKKPILESTNIWKILNRIETNQLKFEMKENFTIPCFHIKNSVGFKYMIIIIRDE